MVSVTLMNHGITLTCILGLALSIYAFFVESMAERDDDYRAMCDLSEHMSCTKVFKSDYARGFGIFGRLFGKESFFNKPNSLTGILSYSLLATLAQSNSLLMTKISYAMIVLSNLMSVYLAYVLYFILYDLCVVCVSMYVVNFFNWIFVHYKYKELSQTSSNTSPKLKRT
ncbi:PREDICTED: vitamin K epoxide reductase complex subunit 1-like protein 1 [Nicrophorus vespilloides]|uniref:vitamin-K-epoxide reductase (warfarin-sensitive) n=1 Tax=Nicrophorus vespilloides TaxID=110193 RepID=A0ABM1MP25_NICVS|nr:PREDICTED: vitamin K epoxide reductase complex subunit 1-like protein 1 [Nicrophorus vespilloides]